MCGASLAHISCKDLSRTAVFPLLSIVIVYSDVEGSVVGTKPRLSTCEDIMLHQLHSRLRCLQGSVPQNISQAFQDAGKACLIHPGQAVSDALDGDSTYLAYLYPGPLGQTNLGEFHGQGETCPGFLAGQGHG